MTTIVDFVQRLRTEAPAAVAGLQDRDAVRLLREAFGTIARDLEAADEGVHKVAGLGVFRVRKAPVKPDGTGGGKLIGFRPGKRPLAGGIPARKG